MKASILFILFFISQFVFALSDDWGATGHRATAAIAEEHLSKKTKKAIEALLDGETLVSISTYADDIKSDNAFRKYSAWHYVNIPFEDTYETIVPSEKGDIISAIENCISVLNAAETTQEDKKFHLKLLVHFMGDLHQPLHLGLEGDKGGNDIKVKWFGASTNLHAVWDSKMIDSYGMSYSELALNFPKLSKAKVKELQSGNLLDWVEEIREETRKIYESAADGDSLGYRYMYDYFSIVEQQLQYGGVRLAKILNTIFG
jgi:hypothetical protein